MECALGLEIKPEDAIQRQRKKDSLEKLKDVITSIESEKEDLFAAAFATGESRGHSTKENTADVSDAVSRSSLTATSSGGCRRRDFTDLVVEEPSVLTYLNAYVEAERPKVATLLTRMLRVEPAKRAECLALMRMPLLEAYLSRDAKERANRSKPSLSLKRAESDEIHPSHRDGVSPSSPGVPAPLYGNSYYM